MLPKVSISTLAAATPFAAKLKAKLEQKKTAFGRTIIKFKLDELLTPVRHDGESYLIDVLLASRALSTLLLGSSEGKTRLRGIETASAVSLKRHFHYCHGLASKDRTQDARSWAAEVLRTMAVTPNATGLYYARIDPEGLEMYLREPVDMDRREAAIEMELPSDGMGEGGLLNDEKVRGGSSSGPDKAAVASAAGSSSTAKSVNQGKKTVKPAKRRAKIVAAYAREADYLIQTFRHDLALSALQRKEALERCDEAKAAVSMEMDEEVIEE